MTDQSQKLQQLNALRQDWLKQVQALLGTEAQINVFIPFECDFAASDVVSTNPPGWSRYLNHLDSFVYLSSPFCHGEVSICLGQVVKNG